MAQASIEDAYLGFRGPVQLSIIGKEAKGFASGRSDRFLSPELLEPLVHSMSIKFYDEDPKDVNFAQSLLVLSPTVLPLANDHPQTRTNEIEDRKFVGDFMEAFGRLGQNEETRQAMDEWQREVVQKGQFVVEEGQHRLGVCEN